MPRIQEISILFPIPVDPPVSRLVHLFEGETIIESFRPRMLPRLVQENRKRDIDDQPGPQALVRIPEIGRIKSGNQGSHAEERQPENYAETLEKPHG